MDDIASRLRGQVDQYDDEMSIMLSDAIEEAADEIERLRAALLDVPDYIDNDQWREKHKDLLRSIGAWMGGAVDPGGHIYEADFALKQKPTDQ